MSTLRTVSAVLVAAVALTSTAALADSGRGWGGWGGWGSTRTPGIDRTQAEQAAEIARGQRNGSLTSREVADLRAEQASIAEMERRAKADGIVTRSERERIRNAQASAGRHIQQEENDRERAGSRGGFRRWW